MPYRRAKGPRGVKRKPSLFEKAQQVFDRASIRQGDRIVVAVSGGADSVCLLYLLKELSMTLSLSLHVAHLNHGLRAEAEDEAQFVAALSKSWGIPFTTDIRSVLETCRESKCSIQTGARTVRYRFLNDVAQAVGAQWIALGHTADDQAETFLMRALRGAGVGGLSGMHAIRKGSIVRPLLDCTRKEILATLAEGKISFIEDPSNNKRVYHRNHIRHVLIPILEKYNPKVKEALCREAMLLQDEDDFVDQSMAALLPKLAIEIDPDTLAFDMDGLRAAHPAIQRRLIRWGFQKLLGDGKALDFQSTEVLRSMIEPGCDKRSHCLTPFLKAEIEWPHLYLKRRVPSLQADRTPTERILSEITAGLVSIQIDLPEWELKVNISLKSGPPSAVSACKASFDFDKLTFPLSIRGRRPGDRFIPFGMKGKHKKLQDFFVDTKIPRSERHRRAILSSPKEIVWVMGLRVDERFCATKDSTRTLTIDIVSV
ncbi:tRNA lysidine(34) synthetase TilS [Nitrospira defluvii]|nr:tRNA lysidine(34) synthetase TilS [Nitrospira defluvii]